jgi:hypothetical protein
MDECDRNKHEKFQGLWFLFPPYANCSLSSTALGRCSSYNLACGSPCPIRGPLSRMPVLRARSESPPSRGPDSCRGHTA